MQCISERKEAAIVNLLSSLLNNLIFIIKISLYMNRKQALHKEPEMCRDERSILPARNICAETSDVHK